jgi:transcriptional regulator GlxA family with amidase domain
MPKTIAIAIFDGFQILDATGPGQVFATANALSGKPLYDVRMLASKPGPVRANGGMILLAEPLNAEKPHTVIASGGDEAAIVAASQDKALIRWVAAQSKLAKRLCSVCSGAFLLAAAGALKNKRAATHWAGAETLARMFPDIQVERDAIYVQDGKIWTSAGVTTGIDMALALVAQDHGRDLAAQIARQLVVYMHRPGHQSQFSAPLKLQSSGDARMQKLAAWTESRLSQDLDAQDLADTAGMSLRNFHRHMKTQLNTTPKRWIEDLRLARARTLLEETTTDLAAIAREAGFSGPDHLIKTFDRRFGLTPGAYRRLHSVSNGASPLEPRAAAQ